MIWVDIIIEHNVAAIEDAIKLAKHDISVRADLKETGANVSLHKDVVNFTADNKEMLKQVIKLFEEKLKISSVNKKSLQYQAINVTMANVEQKAILQRIFDIELTNEVVNKINQLPIPVKIDARPERIILSADTAAKIQEIQDKLKKCKFKLPITFTNYHENHHPDNVYDLFTIPKK